MSLIDHYTGQDFSLNAFDKLLEIQVSFEVLTCMLKDGKKKFVEAEDTISHVRVITDSTQMSNQEEMEAILTRFEEFHKSDEEEKNE